MKIVLTLGCATIAFAAMAQHTHQYDQSVFAGFQNVPSVNAVNVHAQQQIQKALPGWSCDIDKLTGMPRNVYGPKINVPGTNLQEKGTYIIKNILPVLGNNDSNWHQLSIVRTRKASYIRFNQVANGHKVAFALLTARLTADSIGIVVLENKSYGNPDTSLTPITTLDEAMATATADLTNVRFTAKNVADWEWFPIPSSNGYRLHPAWHFTASGVDELGGPVALSGYVDAINGSLLYRVNGVKETFNVTIKGNVYKNNTTNPPTDEPLANLAITIDNNTYYTDSAGKYTDPIMAASKIVTIPLQGNWSTVSVNGTTPSFMPTIAANGVTYIYPATAPSSSRQVNAYYHVNRVHDFMKAHYPAFTGMDFSLATNVDVTPGDCNAYYLSSYGNHPPSINFYTAGNGCNSFAEVGDIIYHEYGHGISDKFYVEMVGNSIMNGALNEGNSDVWSMGITHTPIIGVNAYTNGDIIRRYDQGAKVYPKDIEGETHSDGEIIAGIWWDVATNIGNVDIMANIFTDTYYSAPDGPNGTEGQVYYDVLIAALMSDDNDNNINNGTPHFVQIVNAFAKHGIYLFQNISISHTELSHQPIGNAIKITATVATSYPTYFHGLELFYRKRNSSWDSLVLTNSGNMVFEGQIPAQTQGILDYYFKVNDTLSGSNVYAPAGFNPFLVSTQSTIPYQFGVGIIAMDSNTFETEVADWNIGSNLGDNAKNGKWVRAIPIPSYYESLICQSGNDHTSGKGQCLVTGNASDPAAPVNAADVDSGLTTVLTPVFDLSSYQNPVIEYYRWYSNDRGGAQARSDRWQVYVRDATNSLWKLIEQTYQSDYNWRRRIFGVGEYLTKFNKIQLKFVASDLIDYNALQYDGQSTVEAAVDDFFIYDYADVESVEQIAVSKASVYPNPAEQQVNVVMTNNKANGSLALYDMTGKIARQLAVVAGISKYSIATTSIAAGNYLLLIQTDKTIQTIKISITH